MLKKIKEDATGEFRTTLMNLIEVTAVMPSDCDWTRMYNISQNARDQLLISNRLGNIWINKFFVIKVLTLIVIL